MSNPEQPAQPAPRAQHTPALHPEPIIAALQEAIIGMNLTDNNQKLLADTLLTEVAKAATVRVKGLQETIAHTHREATERAYADGAAARRPHDDGALANLKREEDRFWKKNPLFFLGKETWGVFMNDFNLASRLIYDDQTKKQLLFQCLRGEAKILASNELYPTLRANEVLTFEQYQKKMNELFEPTSESENAKLEFTERQQLVGERPTTYFTVKQNLFDRAWPEEMRDMQFFFDETTKGLLNETMKASLWTMQFRSYSEYKDKLQFLAGMVQKRYRAKEIAQSDTIGAETFTVGQQVTTSDGYQMVKMEPGIHALSEEDKVCFYCRKKGHFVRNCPRKIAGLTAPAAAIEEGDDDEDKDEEADAQEVNFIRNGRVVRGRVSGFRRNNRFPRSNPYRKPTTRNDNRQVRFKELSRIGVIYTDPEGVQYIQEEEDEPIDDEEHDNEGVNTIDLDEQQDREDYSEADFIPHPFLGMSPNQQ